MSVCDEKCDEMCVSACVLMYATGPSVRGFVQDIHFFCSAYLTKTVLLQKNRDRTVY